MALQHFSKVFGTKELRIAKLTADPAGGPATYAASVVVPGSKKIALTGVVDVKHLRGDNMELDVDVILKELAVSFDYSRLNLDALAVMFSTAVVDSGVTPNQLETWALKNTDTLNAFKIDARCVGAEHSAAGDFEFTLWKNKLAGFPPLGTMEEDYALPSVSCVVIPRYADGAWISVIGRETAAVLT